MSRRKKPTFILKIDPNLVHTKYEFDLISNISSNVGEKTDTTKLTTLIDELPSTRDTDTNTYSFLDESKQTHSCVVTMNDLLTSTMLPKSTNVSCFWCKHCFQSSPIGCPVSYLSNKVTKVYHSEITKDEYRITDNITKKRKEMLNNLMEKHNSQFTILDNHSNYFVVDGIFCSFNCCLAFIKSRRDSDFYKLSESLLYTMYKDIFKTKHAKIKPAPHWRLLEKFGGPLSIENFRNSFNSIQYNDIDDYIIRAPPSRMVGKLYEKKVRF